MNSAPVCPICNKRGREKGRTRNDGTIWYRPTCYMCRKLNKRPDTSKQEKTLLKELELLRRYKKAMEILCERQCVDIDDVLKKYAPEDDSK